METMFDDVRTEEYNTQRSLLTTRHFFRHRQPLYKIGMLVYKDLH